jgi:endothelin-converting enzyme/putative endopeptidase
MRITLCFLGITLTAGLTMAQRNPGFDVQYLDRSADPCQDFYKFSCGGWMKANPLPGDQARWGRFDVLQDTNRTVLQNLLESVSGDKSSRVARDQKIGDMYYSCMDQKTVDQKAAEPLKMELDRIAALSSKNGLAEMAAHLTKIGTNPLLRFGSEPDAKDSNQVIAGLDQGGLGMPDRDYYLKTDEKSVGLRAKYVAYLETIYKLLGYSPADASKKAQAVMTIETELAKVSLDRVSRRDPQLLYHKLKVSELEQMAPNFEWKAFFKDIGAPPLDSLDVSVPDFFKGLNALIEKTSLDNWKDYFQAVLVRDNAPVLASTFEQASFEFFGKAMSGAKEMRPRWKRCVDLVDGGLPDALGQKFIDKTLGADGKRRSREMLQGIEKAMSEDIRSLDWMTSKTKEQAQIKLRAVMNKIGDKAHWLDYNSVKIARDDLFGNGIRTSEFGVAHDLSKIGKPHDKLDWAMSQPTVNAYYEPQENSVNFPAGILQPPFYDNKMDDAVNYGAIGAVIGHELTHGFDDQGRQYDYKGNLKDWWTEEDAKAFKMRTECLVEEYGGFEPVPGAKLNGQLTLGENTADNGGVRLAYTALLEHLGKDAAAQQKKTDGFTPQQRFFLAFAQVWCQNDTEEDSRRRVTLDPHSPGPFRVNGVVSNMPEFKQAFSCKAGQPMVRPTSCRVW